MNMNELVTAVSYKLPIVVVLLDNTRSEWSAVQTLFFEGRYSQTTLNRKTIM